MNTIGPAEGTRDIEHVTVSCNIRAESKVGIYDVNSLKRRMVRNSDPDLTSGLAPESHLD